MSAQPTISSASNERLLTAIRWFQERLVFWSMGLSVIAIFFSGYFVGKFESKSEAIDQRMQTFEARMIRDQDQMKEEVDVLGMRYGIVKQILEANGIDTEELE